jgi:putative oxidoreductase
MSTLLTGSRETASSHPALSYTDGIATLWQDFLILVGRVIVGWIFVLYGWGKLFSIPNYAKTFPGRGLPEWLAYVAVPVEFFGGLALLLGFATRYAVLLMLAFMLVATFSSHRWWTFPEAQRGNQQAHFWKNVAMMGGMLALFVTGGGRFSIDALLRRR